MKTITKKIALFKCNYIGETPCDSKLIPDGYVQITDWQNIEFTCLPPSIVISEEVKAIDAEIEDIKAAAMVQLEELQTKKQELLALGVSK